MLIYIIPESMEIKDAVEPAKTAGCERISYDIPPELVNSITQADLPMVYTFSPEPFDSTHISTIDAIDTEIDKLKARLEKLEKKP